ncbi:solute carrier family 39 (zinc transporter), member 1/2/3 [Cryptococcus neoformans c45]|nr:solute carrier family 39 (zinc transporter), member 1/2/3 [Cryptococcus neoformans var. grubii c45]
MSRKLQHNQQHLMAFSLLEKGALQPIAITLACLATARADFIDEIVDNADSSCAAGEATGDYNMRLHIASVFVLLVASGLGVFLPVILGEKRSRSVWFGNTFFVLKYFGTGIIISLA